MDAYVNVDGETVLEIRLIVPQFGPWWAELSFEDEAVDLSGSVTLTIGDTEFSGTIDPDHDGTFALQRTSRIVGGAGGWGALVSAQHYHNDAGVTARSVADDAARLAGETIGDFAPAANTVGVDYVRQAGNASRVVEDVIGDRAWWVGYDGRTHIGERTESAPVEGTYQVLQSNPREGMVTIGVDDISSVLIGSILTEGLEAPLTVRELDVRITADTLRAVVWGGGGTSRRGRLAGILRDIVQRTVSDRLFGKYRYRVVQMTGESEEGNVQARAELQAVAAVAGLPDVLPISMRPGVAGSHGKLAHGSIVLLEFIEGDRTMPIVSAFAGVDEEGHAPREQTFSVTSQLLLGDESAIDPVALAPSIDSQFDDINAALDLLAATMPVAMDGGAALQTAFKGAWGSGSPPKPASNVGASKVKAS